MMPFTSFRWIPWPLILAVPSILSAASLEVPSGTIYRLSAGQHQFEKLTVYGTLQLEGDVEMVVTGNPLAPSEPALEIARGTILGSGKEGTRGADGVAGEPGADGVRGTGPDDLGSGGRRGADGTSGGNGTSGGHGHRLKLIVLGDATLTDGLIHVDGGRGGGGGRGGSGGNGGSWGGGAYIGAPIFPGGSGGHGGDGGSGAPGGNGGSIWLSVQGSLHLENSRLSAVGGDGGSGNLGAVGGMVGDQPYSGYPTGTPGLPVVGVAGRGDHGAAAGAAGEIHIFVEGDLSAVNTKIPTVPGAIPAYKFDVSGGRGGAGSTDVNIYYPRDYSSCWAGAGGPAGVIDVLVKGRLEETHFPMLANGGNSGFLYKECTGLTAPPGARGGRVSCRALGGIFWNSPQLYYGATGGEGGTISGSIWNNQPPADRGLGGDGGLIELIAKTLELSNAPVSGPIVPGVSAGLGGADNSTGVRTNSGSPGLVQITLSPPLLVPELQVWYGDRQIRNGESNVGPITSTGTTATLATFTVRNVGTAPLRISRLETPFTLTDPLSDYILAGGDSDTFTLSLPAEPNSSSGAIRIEHNDGRANPFEFQVAVSPGNEVRIAAEVIGNKLRITWPPTSGRLRLESSPFLGLNASWAPCLEGATLIDGLMTVTIPIGVRSGFYRLVQ